MIKMIIAIKRREGMSREEFVRFQREIHRPLLMSIPEARRYIRWFVVSYPIPAPDYSGPDYDSVVEARFDSMEDMNALYSSENFLRRSAPITRASWNTDPSSGPFEGAPMLLSHHVGARSGVRRANPLAYRAVDGAYAVFASNAGRDSHPAWYHNLLVQPRVTVEVGTGEFEAVPRVAEGEEREDIWERQKRLSPNFANYEAGTERQIPVVILEPAGAGG